MNDFTRSSETSIVKCCKKCMILVAFCVVVLSGCKSQGILPEKDKKSVKEERHLLWHYGVSTSRELVENITEKFYEDSGIIIEWLNPEDKTLKSYFASGNAPDVFMLSAQELEKWRVRLYDLDEQEWKSGIFPVSLDFAEVDGHLYSMPITYDACGIIYNKELFSKVGITDVPQSVSELRNVCEKLEESGIRPFGECYQLPGYAGHMLSVLFAYEPDLEVSLNLLGSKEITVSEFEYYEQWQELFDITIQYGGKENILGYGIDDLIADFASGEIAMVRQGTWLEKHILMQNPDIDMGLMAIPCTENAEDCRLMITTTNHLCINKDSEHIEEALIFLNWLYDNAETYFVDMEGSSVCFESVDRNKMGALNKDAMEYIQSGQTFPYFGSEDWPDGYNSDVLTIFQDYLVGNLGRDDIGNYLTEAYWLRSSHIIE